MQPPNLKNDCFALPPGVHWTPVDEALDLLRQRLQPVVTSESLPVGLAAGRVLAEGVTARRSNPPTANSAVDGYGFAHAALGKGVQILPLISARAAAGQAFDGEVPLGSAIRILTGARLPIGVDTVVLEEDVTLQDVRIAFHDGLKKGANTRAAGEDVKRGGVILDAGHRLQPQDIALLAAVGVGQVSVFRHLRVGVLSTGDEIVPPGGDASDTQIYDANRPMLLAVLARWGLEAVDLGHVGDDRARLKAALDQAAERTDAILTSGGASAGDEDHMSAILNTQGTLHSWRIAMKPGRPLALGMWNGVPVFGLPGNPVAAFVCTLIFARPALGVLAGRIWQPPVGYLLPAAFSKSKKEGRREYLRARLDADGRVEVYHSEGSGRIAGLGWADGLVELADDARDINPDDAVRYYPYGAFDL